MRRARFVWPWSLFLWRAADARRCVLLIRSASELAEVRLALLAIRPATLFRFFGVVVEAECRHAHAGDAANGFRIRIERALGERERGRTTLHQFFAPAIDLGIEFVVRNGDIGEPHFDRLCRAVASVEVPDLARLLLAHHASKIGCSKAGIDGPDLRSDLTELRLVGRNRQVANRRKHVAAADRKPVDPGNDGFGHVTNHTLELVYGQSDRAAAVVLSVVCALITTGAKRLVAGAGQYDNSDRLVPTCALKCVDELFDRLTTERIVTRWPVDRDAGDALRTLLVNDVFISRHGLFLSTLRGLRRAIPRIV